MAAAKKSPRVLDALPDSVDFRDKMYVPTLVDVRREFDLNAYRAARIPVLDQGREGACTGFGLATVVNYLLQAHATGGAMPDPVSPRMLYVIARRYDEWRGEDYEGSSARGAMKGWHKHGVCMRALWKDSEKRDDLDRKRTVDALERPLGAYFRVNHKDVVAMHSAISEVGILYASASVHEGWMNVKEGDEEISYSPVVVGGHAFAIVGYDRHGLWIQNSWGPDWGSGGLARVSYADWLENGSDVWVARLGAPVDVANSSTVATMRSGAPRSYESHSFATLRPHVVVADNDGTLIRKGPFAQTADSLRAMLRTEIPPRVAAWPKKRVLLYSHGGLVPQDSALQYIANYLPDLLAAQIYPIAFIWRSDAWTTITNILRDALSKRHDEGVLDAAKDFMLDRLDDTLEPIARTFGGKAMWNEMKENATLAASRATGAARMTATHLAALFESGVIEEIHLAGHSAGSILLAPLAQFLAAKKVPIKSLSLWAPACTMQLFQDVYRPMIEAGDIEAFDLATLDDVTERDDDCANIYHKSLLYLVSAAFEAEARIPIKRPNGTPILGLARDVASGIPKSFWTKRRRWIVAPGDPHSTAHHHGDFDNDANTLRTTLRRITGDEEVELTESKAGASTAGKVRRRRNLNIGLAGGKAAPALAL